MHWDMDRLIQRHSPRTLLNPNIQKPLKPSDITHDRLKDAYHTVASIVTHHGEDYLPIFERLDHELQNFEKKQSLLEKAFTVAKGSTP